MGKTVHLVTPRSTLTQRTFHEYGWIPPVRLEYLAHALDRAGIETRIFDLNRENVCEDELFGCDVFGVSVWHDQYSHGLELLRTAHERGLRTLIGGAQTKGSEHAIANRHPFIDQVVSGYTEDIIVALVSGELNERVVMNTGNSVPAHDIDLSHLQHDLSRLELDAYTYLPLATMRGCDKAAGKGACLFCSEDTDRPARTKADLFWQQIESLNRRYGIRQFFETGSTFPTQPSFLRTLVEEKPAGLDISLKVYSRVEALRPEQISLFKQVGVAAVFLGIENISPKLTRSLGKSSRPAHIENTARLLAAYGIETYMSFVHGLPGDDIENVRRNVEFSERMLEIKGVRVGHSVLAPIPGSQSFKMIERHASLRGAYRLETGRDLQSDDFPDLSLLSKLFVGQYTTLDLQALESELENFRTRALAIEKGTFVFLE